MKLKSSESVFLSLLRAGLWNCSPDLPGNNSQLMEVVALAKAQSLLGIVGDVLLKCNRQGLEMPNELRLKLKSFKVNNMMMADRLNEEMKKVFSLLEVSGMSPVLLKGAGLACNYPVPALRQLGDVDIYVGEEDYLKSYEVLRPLADRIPAPDELWIDKNYSLSIDNVELEIHRVPDEHPSRKADRCFQQFARDHMMKDSVKLQIGDSVVETPSDTFNAVYIFLHMFRHFMYRGVGLRQVCDWMMLMARKRDRMDLAALTQVLEDMKLIRPWKDFAAVAVTYLGCPSDSIPLCAADVPQTRQMKILRRILDEGNFGKETAYHKNRPKIYIVAKIASLSRHIQRFLSLAVLYPCHFFPYMRLMFRFGFGGIGRDMKSGTNAK